MSGIFISQGMSIAIPAGGFSIGIGDDGQITGGLVLHARFDVCPTWIQLALQHGQEALDRRTARIDAWTGSDEDAKASTLEREFEASMQAVMAAAISIDAFYALVRPHVSLPPSLQDSWRTNRTARHTQIAHVVSQGFGLNNAGSTALSQNLEQIFSLRNKAVHPSGKMEAPVLHPEINVGVEWRFAWFRALNAESVVYTAAAMLWDLANNGQPKNAEIGAYQQTLRARLQQLFPNGRPSTPPRP